MIMFNHLLSILASFKDNASVDLFEEQILTLLFQKSKVALDISKG